MYREIDGLRLHYNVFGKGAPILFIHGWGGSRCSMHSLAKHAARRFQCFTIDLPGFGKSENPPKHWGVKEYAQCILQFMKQQKIVPHYFGHSFGGELGIYIAAHHPASIRSLILCNSSFKRSRKISRTASLASQLNVNSYALIKKIYPFAKKIYYSLFHRGSDLLKYPALESNFRTIIFEDLTETTKIIKKPTLILWGENDTITPVLWAWELHRNIPRSKIVVVPKATHNLPITQPAIVWKELASFIS
ncbi:alpha/beta hydrolase [Candidatus Woesebacteria bacterium]|nr:alpha/beta hydrolase [Candidatus Woesebacteria bacterium]